MLQAERGGPDSQGILQLQVNTRNVIRNYIQSQKGKSYGLKLNAVMGKLEVQL